MQDGRGGVAGMAGTFQELEILSEPADRVAIAARASEPSAGGVATVIEPPRVGIKTAQGAWYGSGSMSRWSDNATSRR
jgi:hypothetical protein